MTKVGVIIFGSLLLIGGILLYIQMNDFINEYQSTSGQLQRETDPNAKDDYETKQDIRTVSVFMVLIGILLVMVGFFHNKIVHINIQDKPEIDEETQQWLKKEEELARKEEYEKKIKMLKSRLENEEISQDTYHIIKEIIDNHK